MTQVTERSPMLSPGRGQAAALVSAFARGVIAAGLGLGALAVLAMALWISSPYPATGPGEALHASAALWLLGHGADLVRADTLSGAPAPVATAPLLLMAGPVWLLYRAGRDALTGSEDHGGDGRDGGADGDGLPSERPSGTALLYAVVAGYLLVAGGVVGYVRGAALDVDRATLAYPLVVVVVGAVAAGVWAASGRPAGGTPSWAPLRLQEAVARSLFRARAETVWRASTAGVLVLLGGGALLVTVALVRDLPEAQHSFLTLAGDWAGRIAVLLLALALVPNAACWGAAYGLGPGFALGTGAMVTPLGAEGAPALPDFPLLAAVPGPGPGTALNWAAAAIPVAAACAVAWFTVGRAAPAQMPRAQAWSAGETARVTLVAAVGCGIGTALLTAFSGGALGTGVLAAFGPVWWWTGAAAVLWTAALGVPFALLLRHWRLRDEGWAWRRDAAMPAVRPTPAVTAETAPDGSGGVKDVSAGGGPKAVAASSGGGTEGKKGRWWRRGRRDAGGAPTGEPTGAPTGAAEGPPAALSGAPGAEGTTGPAFEPYDFMPADPWHDRQQREARWASLKRASGGLMGTFPAAPPAPVSFGEAVSPGKAASLGRAADRVQRDPESADRVQRDRSPADRVLRDPEPADRTPVVAPAPSAGEGDGIGRATAGAVMSEAAGATAGSGGVGEARGAAETGGATAGGATGTSGGAKTGPPSDSPVDTAPGVRRAAEPAAAPVAGGPPEDGPAVASDGPRGDG
ncbi:DUF6350 family protein [uncultured Streptomyces sp.]|uniref:cell division protein PerM n=1 Tax=uncultured Streptomyces sp. TaxID=174707 RepID=UPI00343A3596